MFIGFILIISALSLALYNFYTDKKAGEISSSILLEIKQKIPDFSDTISQIDDESEDLFKEYETDKEAAEEPYIVVDNLQYIGYISIPDLDIELPVLKDWSYPNLKISPCRYKGTAYEKNLIIAAHNYNSHFGKINELSGGELIIFTDALGKTYKYEVSQTELIDGKNVEDMEFKSDNNWDLTLFTCNLSGQARVTVRAVLVG